MNELVIGGNNYKFLKKHTILRKMKLAAQHCSACILSHLLAID